MIKSSPMAGAGAATPTPKPTPSAANRLPAKIVLETITAFQGSNACAGVNRKWRKAIHVPLLDALANTRYPELKARYAIPTLKAGESWTTGQRTTTLKKLALDFGPGIVKSLYSRNEDSKEFVQRLEFLVDESLVNVVASMDDHAIPLPETRKKFSTRRKARWIREWLRRQPGGFTPLPDKITVKGPMHFVPDELHSPYLKLTLESRSPLLTDTGHSDVEDPRAEQHDLMVRLCERGLEIPGSEDPKLDRTLWESAGRPSDGDPLWGYHNRKLYSSLAKRILIDQNLNPHMKAFVDRIAPLIQEDEINALFKLVWEIYGKPDAPQFGERKLLSLGTHLFDAICNVAMKHLDPRLQKHLSQANPEFLDGHITPRDFSYSFRYHSPYGAFRLKPSSLTSILCYGTRDQNEVLDLIFDDPDQLLERAKVAERKFALLPEAEQNGWYRLFQYRVLSANSSEEFALRANAAEYEMLEKQYLKYAPLRTIASNDPRSLGTALAIKAEPYIPTRDSLRQRRDDLAERISPHLTPENGMVAGGYAAALIAPYTTVIALVSVFSTLLLSEVSRSRTPLKADHGIIALTLAGGSVTSSQFYPTATALALITLLAALGLSGNNR